MKSILSRSRAAIDRLGFRLAVVLAVALLPLMVISITRSQSVLSEAITRSQSALIGETLRAVRQEVIMIERAKAVAQSLSHSVPILLNDPELCNQLMRDKLVGTAFSFAGFYDISGHVPCSSSPEPFTYEMTPDLAGQIADPKPTVLVYDDAPVSGTSVIYASHPVFADDGTLFGFTTIAVPNFKLRQIASTESDTTFLTLNGAGTVLTAPGKLEDAMQLFPRLKPGEDIIQRPSSFREFSRDGIERLYAIVPVVDGELYALSSWPLEREIGGGFFLKSPTLFPALMWLASLCVAWFATSMFVTRHVVRLRRAMQVFAATRQTTKVAVFRTAPKELRDVAETFTIMTDTILRDEAQIEDTLRQKDILLREVHHRVKNNLQLIASIMSMQMRKSKSNEVHQLMQGLHDRVNSLATIHHSLYQTTGQADISMDEHLDVIVRHVVRMAESRGISIDLDTNFTSLRLNPDQAVPLSLFVTEAVTNALKYIGGSNGGAPKLHVSLARLAGNTAKVTISNTTSQKASKPDTHISSGLGTELIEAFAEQLSGNLKKGLSGDQFTVSLEFPADPLSNEM